MAAAASHSATASHSHQQQDAVTLGICCGFLPLAHDAFTSLTKCGGTATFHPNIINDEHRKVVLEAQVKEWTTCRCCGSRMYLVTQAFAPIDTTTAASSSSAPHNRMLYVYACNSIECAEKPLDSWCAFSIQLDEEDLDALEADDEASDEPIPVEATPKEFLPPFSFPPLEIDIVPEPRKEIIVPTDVEAELIKAAEANMKAPASEEDIRDLEDQLDLKDKPIDVYFDKFRRRVARMPDQVIRYQRGGLPIYMNLNKTLDLTVPACEHCGGRRWMEVQVMPTLLYFLKSKQYVPPGKRSGDDGVDFATATVFTCANGCLASKPGMIVQKEFLFVEPAPHMSEEASADGRPSLRSYFSASDEAN